MGQFVLMLAMAFAAVLGATGQMFMTKGSSSAELTLKGLLTNPWLWGFVGTYGLAVVINFVVYKMGGKPSIMYPVIATSYVWTVVFAAIFLGEPLTAGKVVGSVAIVAGVVCIAVW